MYPFAKELQVSDKNKLTSYLPIRNKGNDFSWESVTGLVLSHALRQELVDFSLDAFRDECHKKFEGMAIEPEVWDLLDDMYFSTKAFFQVSPLFFLFKAQKNTKEQQEHAAANQRMGDLFAGLLADFKFQENPKESLHFIEQVMLDVLNAQLRPVNKKDRIKELPYLPFLAEAFHDDIRFLATHPKYLMAELANTLKLYAFGYCSQLALSINDWRGGLPKPKELYFILDMEKASTERAKMRDRGYKLFSTASQRLFPILSAREAIQPEEAHQPLWKIYADAKEYPNQQELVANLNTYVSKFAESRQLPSPSEAGTLEEAFKNLIDLAVAQFEQGKSERYGVNQRYVRELEHKICADFIQFRGRAGNVFVLNQDQLLLLTNLAIGQSERLIFFELLREYERRGFFFDNQSQQVLIEFFERMGNVDRMSDSGEAVYVRKTV